MKTRLILGAMLVFSVGFTSLAQDETAPKGTCSKNCLNNLSVGINTGLLHFYGDLRQYDYYPVTKYHNETKAGIGTTVSKTISNVFTVQGQILYGALSGTKRSQKIYFTTNIFETNISAIVNLSNLVFKPSASGKIRKNALYAFAGYGLVHFNSQVKTLDGDDEIKNYMRGTSGKANEVAVPVGIGIKRKLTDNLDLSFEASFRNVNTDKLDAWVVTGSSRDKYGYTSLHLNYKLGAGRKTSSPGAQTEDLQWVNPLESMYQQLQDVKQKVDNINLNDSDGDGVADTFDKEANTPRGNKTDGSGTSVNYESKISELELKIQELTAKLEELASRPVTTPTTVAAAENEGYAQLTKTGAPLPGSFPILYFDKNSYTLLPSDHVHLVTIANALKSEPKLEITIIGHSDESGIFEHNLKISRKRANAVANYLSNKHNIAKARMDIQAKGESEPVSAKEMNLNRRVEIKVF